MAKLSPIQPPLGAIWGVRTEGYNASGFLKDTGMFLTAGGEGVYVGSLHNEPGWLRRVRPVKTRDIEGYIIRYQETRVNLGYPVVEIWTPQKGWHPAGPEAVEVPRIPMRTSLSTIMKQWQAQGAECF